MRITEALKRESETPGQQPEPAADGIASARSRTLQLRNRSESISRLTPGNVRTSGGGVTAVHGQASTAEQGVN